METQNIQRKKNRKYNTDFRKRLANRFEKVRDKNDLIEIYNIITDDIGTNFSSNINGIFINMNLLSDKCIEKLISIEEKINLNFTQSDTEKSYSIKSDIKFSPEEGYIHRVDDVEIISEMGHKLSNQEKHLIKKIRN